MAKMFYTLEEAKSALSKNEDEIKQFAREGRLREYRDGAKLMFKAEQVEQLKGQLGSGDQVDLGVSDSGGLIGLVDTTGASGTSITLSDADAKEASGPGMKLKEDTALAADLGLSGSLGGVPSPTRSGSGLGMPASGSVAPGLGGSMSGGSVAGGSLSGGSLSGGSLSGGSLSGGSLSGGSLSGGSIGGTKAGLGASKAGSFQGINVFGAEESEMVDPSAQTAISGGFRDQINLQDVGSGSGLLDLSRESDDTSLGAVLDEITPAGASRPGMESATNIGTIVAPPSGGRVVSGPIIRESPDPWAPAFGGAALAASAVIVYGIFVLASAVLGSRPDAVIYFAKQAWYLPMVYGLGGCVIFFVIGAIIGKSTVRR